ncbi:MAG: hypothetical protein AB7O68_22930 [Pirellulales bacterium]
MVMIVLAVHSGAGCTHRQLVRNTALTATTVNSIQYRMVLDNLAMMSCEPANLPSHVRLADGTVQISNEAGFGESGGFSALKGLGFGFEQWGPAASTKVSEQWGTDAVEDPIQVRALQTIYRKALGLAPLEEPNFIVAAKKSREKDAPGKSNSDQDSTGADADSSRRENDDSTDAGVAIELLPAPDEPWLVATDDDAGSANGRAKKAEPTADLDAAEFDIPVGWFGLGCKDDVPPDACYVGCYCDRYAWVVAGDVESLAKFTLAVLTITKLEAGETKGRSGLMFTP